MEGGHERDRRAKRRPVKRDVPEVEELGPTPPLEHPAKDIVEILSPMVTGDRLARFVGVLSRRTGSLVTVLDGLSDPHNGAAVLRSCDAFGCHEVQTVRGRWPFAFSSHVSRGTERWLLHRAFEDAESCCDALEARGFGVYVAAMEGTLRPEDLAHVPKAAIVVGNEHRGVSDVFRQRAAGIYRIPMVGFVESLNVSVASAITLYTATQGRHGDLSAADREEALAHFLLAQVRDSDRIVSETLALRAR